MRTPTSSLLQLPQESDVAFASMAGGLRDSSLTRVRPFFSSLIKQDPHGGSWLGTLLRSTPHGPTIFGDALRDTGVLDATLTSQTSKGWLGCFEFGVPAPSSIVAWYIQNPTELQWPAGKSYSEETTRLRRALLFDDPPGRVAAQRLAEAERQVRPSARAPWWRFEGTSMIDCVLMTERLVLTIEGKRTEPLSAATDWYPARSQLVRNLEAAKQLSHGRAWGSLLISEVKIAEGTGEGLDAVLSASAPHLGDDERRELHRNYLGNLTWAEACRAVGMAFDALPDTTANLP